MKKIILGICFLFVLVLMTGCGNGNNNLGGDDKEYTTVTCEIQMTDSILYTYIHRFENDVLVEKKKVDTHSFETEEAAQAYYDGLFEENKQFYVVDGKNAISTRVEELTDEAIEFAGTLQETFDRMSDPKYNYTCRKS